MGAGEFVVLDSQYTRLRTPTARPGAGLRISHGMPDKQYEKSPAPWRERRGKRDSAGGLLSLSCFAFAEPPVGNGQAQAAKRPAKDGENFDHSQATSGFDHSQASASAYPF